MTVRVRRAGFPLSRRTKAVLTDGNGYFGVADLKPGRYRVWIGDAEASLPRLEIRVETGRVARADF